MVPSLPLLSCESSVSVKKNPDRKKTFVYLDPVGLEIHPLDTARNLQCCHPPHTMSDNPGIRNADSGKRAWKNYPEIFRNLKLSLIWIFLANEFYANTTTEWATNFFNVFLAWLYQFFLLYLQQLSQLNDFQ